MSTFPNIIKIIIFEGGTGHPISNIAAQIKLFANRKNDYNFILPLSDETGCINVTKDWLLEEIKKEQMLFVMDYSSTLDDCKPYVEVSILDTEALSRAVNAMFLYQELNGISDDEIAKYKNAENSRYHPWSKNIKLESIQNGIRIPLKTKS